MHTLWTICCLLVDPPNRERRHRYFRLLNCVLSGLAGLFVWLIVRLFALNSIDWLICFVGYPVFFHGLLVSSIYLMNVDDDTDYDLED